MTNHIETPALHLQVLGATEDQAPILANLLELYAHDFSEFHDVELGPDGRFGYRDLPLYFREPERHPFLVRIDGKLAGLALVHQVSANDDGKPSWDIAEFFVVRKYRRHNVGTQVAHEVWRRFPGRWQVRVMQSNRTALRFWQKAISWFAGENVQPDLVEMNDRYWHIFSFESKP